MSIQMFTSRPGQTGHDTPFGGCPLVRRAVVSVLRAAGRVQAPWPQRRAGAPWVGGHNEARRWTVAQRNGPPGLKAW